MYNLVKVKEEMIVRAPKKLKEMARLDCRQQQDYMSQVSLYDSRLEFRYQSNMLDTRTTMGNMYKQKACPHCREGQEDGVEESPKHILEDCGAYSARLQSQPEPPTEPAGQSCFPPSGSEPQKIPGARTSVKIRVRCLQTVLHPLIVWSACSVIKVELQARAGAVFTIYVI